MANAYALVPEPEDDGAVAVPQIASQSQEVAKIQQEIDQQREACAAVEYFISD